MAEKALAGLAILFFLLTATFIGLFAGAQNKLSHLSPPSGPTATTTVYTHTHHTRSHHHTSTSTISPAPTTIPAPPPPSPPDEPVEVCLTPACVLLSAQILQQIDTSIDPCEDPYGWATGGWTKRNPLPKSKGNWGTFNQLAADNKKVLLEVLKEDGEKADELAVKVGKEEIAKRENIQKLRTVFNDCIDEDHLNSLRLKPLLPIFESIRKLYPATFPSFSSAQQADLLSTATLSTQELEILREEALSAVQRILNAESQVSETEDVAQLISQSRGEKQHHEDGRKGEKGEHRDEKKGKKHDHDGKKKHKHDHDGEHHHESKREEKLTDVLTFLHSKGIDALFTLLAQGDVGKDPQQQVLWLYQASVGLPSREYYAEPSIRSFYTHTVASLLAEILPLGSNASSSSSVWPSFPPISGGGSRPHSDLPSPPPLSGSNPEKDRLHFIADLAARIVSLESDLAHAGADPEDVFNPSKAYNPTPFDKIDHKLPVNLTAYVSSFIEPGQGGVLGEDVIVTSKSYVKKMGKILEGEEDWVLQAWFGVRSAMSYGQYLGDKVEIRKTTSDLKNLLSGVKSGADVDREEVCLTHVSSVLGHLVGAEFIQRKFTGDSKEKAENIIISVIDAFKTRLETIPWMDKESSKKAIEKAEAIVPKIGSPLYPDETSPLALQKYYASQTIKSGDFFGDVLQANTMDVSRMWKEAAGKQRNADVWEMFGDTVNAYFSPPDNEIVFPAGILQPPFFQADRPAYLNYGAFGAVAAHELAHAFDNTGAQYDNEGFYRQWWSNSTVKEFTKKAQCIAKQYSEYYVEGPDGKKVYENGNFTNGEDIGDSGLRFAYQAWQNQLAEHDGKDLVLPGLNYTASQLFFVGYGSVWSQNISPASAVARIRSDPHSLNQFRVAGTLRNFEVFSDVFQCPVGSKMNRPKERCELW